MKISRSVLVRVEVKWMPIDSPWYAVRFTFSVRDDRMKRSSGIPLKRVAGGAIFCRLHERIAAERFLRSSWTQKTFDRALW